MIYLRLHQAWIEEITSRSKEEQAGVIGAISLLSRNFARIAKFSLCMAISLHSKISLYRKFSLCMAISLYSEFSLCSEISLHSEFLLC